VAIGLITLTVSASCSQILGVEDRLKDACLDNEGSGNGQRRPTVATVEKIIIRGRASVRRTGEVDAVTTG